MTRALLLLSVSCLLHAQDTQALGRALVQIQANSGGVLGVAGMHLESGTMISMHGKERFPMMSVYKVPITLRALALMEAQVLPYRKMLRIAPSDFSRGHSPLRDAYPEGAIVTIGQLMEASIRDSDNTANDVLLNLMGGPESAQKPLDKLLNGTMRIDRSEAQMMADFAKMGPAAFAADPRDSATPEAMTLLLSAIHSRKLMHPMCHDLLIEWMTKTTTGQNRIKALLPPGATVWHKTGTGGDKDGVNLCTNDAGVITLPAGKGHLALTVFLKLSSKSMAERERAIAETALLFYRHFTAQPPK